ncbi:sigma-70 family RNA polymerase sigma factor [Nocardioides jiangxiensis]|uniref:Sigma-70 family RNA polymerase sigma factor n=1 Tax=Nocardioides jiangxiensis TaxID=3064524 RepID=A0ABT9AYF3_9ACTN|nr:sigma-70 family RNA polymerase sigma factor [Nocardioides sp. WY-20]MDO7866953.1 sigma-70 family RNA polymerase sigma factor [Nocardioides sp. WY-20]
MHLSSISANTAVNNPHSPLSRLERRQRTRALLALAHSTSSEQERREALDEVVRINMPVARTLAAPYGGRGIPLDDLEQVAYMALIRAARGYHPDRSGDFLAYAVPTIRGEVKKHFRDHGWTVRPPRRIQELQAEVIRTRSELEQETGHEPDLAEIAEAIGEDEAEVAEAMAADGCFSPSSLDQPVRSSGTPLGELMASEEDGFDAAEARAMLADAIRTLGPRDRKILRMRFFDGLTQKEIGREIGVTQMQVSRLLTRILADLRSALHVDLPAAS